MPSGVCHRHLKDNKAKAKLQIVHTHTHTFTHTYMHARRFFPSPIPSHLAALSSHLLRSETPALLSALSHLTSNLSARPGIPACTIPPEPSCFSASAALVHPHHWSLSLLARTRRFTSTFTPQSVFPTGSGPTPPLLTASQVSHLTRSQSLSLPCTLKNLHGLPVASPPTSAPATGPLTIPPPHMYLRASALAVPYACTWLPPSVCTNLILSLLTSHSEAADPLSIVSIA